MSHFSATYKRQLILTFKGAFILTTIKTIETDEKTTWRQRVTKRRRGTKNSSSFNLF